MTSPDDPTDPMDPADSADGTDSTDPTDSRGPTPMHDEITALVPAAADADPYAVERLLGLLRPMIVKYCRGRIGRGSGYTTADDIAQEVLLAAFHALPRHRFGEAPETFLPYTMVIARNKIADAFRRSSREHHVPLEYAPDEAATESTPETVVLDREQRSRLDALLSALTPGQRDILTLRMHVGLNPTEIAEALGMKPGAVRVGQHRALNALRRRLRELGCPYP